jgi:hypothetical protein
MTDDQVFGGSTDLVFNIQILFIKKIASISMYQFDTEG